MPQAQALANWIARGSTDAAAAPNPIAGFQLRPARAQGYHLWWQPQVVLSEEVRERHGAHSTVRWTRKLADDLIQCVFGPQGKQELESNERELNAARKLVWDALLPVQDLRRKREPQDGWEPAGEMDARERLRFDWAMHSVYDAFTPTYVRQFTPDEVLGWARRAGLVEVRPGAVPSTVIARAPQAS